MVVFRSTSRGVKDSCTFVDLSTCAFGGFVVNLYLFAEDFNVCSSRVFPFLTEALTRQH